MLQPSEAGRFGEWMSKPIIAALVKPALLPLRAVVSKAESETNMMAFVTDHGGHVVSRVVGGGPAFKAGIRVGDVIVTVNGRPVKSMDHDNVLKLLSAPGDLAIGIRRWKDAEPPNMRIKMPRYFARVVDWYREDGSCELNEEVGDEAVKANAVAFNDALDADLVGGELHFADVRPAVRPAVITQGAGLLILSEVAEDEYYTGEQATPGVYGYRVQVPSCPQLYDSVEEEVRQLQWANVTIANSPGGPPIGAERSPVPAPGFQTPSRPPSRLSMGSIGAIDGGTSLMRLSASSPMESIARQKTIEAEQLALKVLHLEREVLKLQGHIEKSHRIPFTSLA